MGYKIGCDECVKVLASAIIEQAIADYRATLKALKNFDETKLEKEDAFIRAAYELERTKNLPPKTPEKVKAQKEYKRRSDSLYRGKYYKGEAESLEKFFRSEWFYQLCDLDVEYVIETMNQTVHEGRIFMKV